MIPEDLARALLNMKWGKETPLPSQFIFPVRPGLNAIIDVADIVKLAKKAIDEAEKLSP